VGAFPVIDVAATDSAAVRSASPAVNLAAAWAEIAPLVAHLRRLGDHRDVPLALVAADACAGHLAVQAGSGPLVFPSARPHEIDRPTDDPDQNLRRCCWLTMRLVNRCHHAHAEDALCAALVLGTRVTSLARATYLHLRTPNRPPRGLSDFDASAWAFVASMRSDAVCSLRQDSADLAEALALDDWPRLAAWGERLGAPTLLTEGAAPAEDEADVA